MSTASVNTALKTGAEPFLEAIRNRRTYYALSDASPISNERIIELIHEVIKHTPSSFNSQTTRAIILFSDHHRKLWSTIVHDALRAVVPDDTAFAASAQKMASFAAAHGTVLFFEDQAGVKAMQDAFPIYADAFPIFSEHSAGMNHFNAWTALEAEGLGANLQHYSPLIDEAVRKEWGVPETWKLEAQLVFGTPVQGPGEKTFKALEERVKVYGN